MKFFKQKPPNISITYQSNSCQLAISWPLVDESKQDDVIKLATEVYSMIVTCVDHSCYTQIINAIDIFANKNMQNDVATCLKSALSKLIADKGDSPVVKPSEAFRNTGV